MQQSWILIGMMGAGKSMVGRELAKLSGRSFADTDVLLQNRFGRPVSQIFATYGEQTFRDHETSILREMQPDGMVLATGGGIILREENWQHMRRIGLIIYLDVPRERLIERLTVSRKKRPLLEVEGWEQRFDEILESRLPIYRQADLCMPIDRDNSAQVAQALLTKLEKMK